MPKGHGRPNKIFYKLSKNVEGEINCVIKDLGTVGTSKHALHIPFVDDSTDYQEYLKWVAEGNTADPAD